MIIKRIIICGCARSGNTLMLHLLETGFENIVKIIRGRSNETFPNKEDLIEGKVIIGKKPNIIYNLNNIVENDLGVITGGDKP
jgi:hypothetical protein